MRVGSTKVTCLWDSGASVSMINHKLMSQILKKDKEIATRLRLPQHISLTGASGKKMEILASYSLHITGKTKTFEAPFLVVKDLKMPLILGCDVMDMHKVTLNLADKTVKMKGQTSNFSESRLLMDRNTTLDPKSETVVELPVPEVCRDSSEILFEGSITPLHDEIYTEDAVIPVRKGKICIVLFNTSKHFLKISAGEVLGTVLPSSKYSTYEITARSEDRIQKEIKSKIPLGKPDLEGVPNQFKGMYEKLINKYNDVFSRGKLDVGNCKILPHEIRLKDDAEIVNIPPYRMPYHLQEVANEYVDTLLAAGIIRKSTSPFCSPLMLVRKANAKPGEPLTFQYRMVHNYKKVNLLLKRCAYPLRNIHELIDRVAENKIYTVIDLSQGYFNQQLKDPHGVSAFSVPGKGHFEYVKSPMGLNSSPAFFQRLLDHVTMGLKSTYVYMDDVIIATQTYAENLKELEETLKRFRTYDLKCNLNKTKFGTGRVQYLGFDISHNEGIRPGRAKIKEITDKSCPTSLKEIKSFLGMCSFFRKVIPKYGEISAALSKLTRKDSGYSKGLIPYEARKSFMDLKNALATRPCVAPVDFSKEFILTVDSSKAAWGAILSQKNEKGEEHPCAYGSSLLSDSDAKLSAYHREQKGILWALKHFKAYLFGKHFTLRTDHRPLTTSATGKLDVLDRIALNIEEFRPFTYEYLKGDNMPADYFSRPNVQNREKMSISVDAVEISKPVENNGTGLPDQQVRILPLGHPDSKMNPALSYDYVRTAQQADIEIKAVAVYLKYKSLPSMPLLRTFVQSWAPNCTIEKGLVTDKGGRTLAPHRLRRDIMQAHHDQRGHSGFEKTLDNISTFWTWSSLSKDVKNHVLSCDVCNCVKPPHKYENTELRKMHEAQGFNDRVHLDCLTNLQTTPSGYKHVLMMVDAYSGFSVAAPMTRTTAEEVIQTFMDKWVSHYSFPRQLVSDNGREFINNQFETLCGEMNIHHISTTPYHSRSNGMAERKIRSLNEFLRTYVNSPSQKMIYWDSLLTSFNLLVNCTRGPHGFSPYFLAHGQEAQIPVENLLGNRFSYQESFVASKLNALKKATQAVFKSKEKQFQMWHAQYKKTQKREAKCEPGQTVYVCMGKKGQLTKLQPLFDGPYTVVSESKDQVVIRKPTGRGTRKVHKDYLRLAPVRELIFAGKDFSQKKQANPSQDKIKPKILPQPQIYDDPSPEAPEGGQAQDAPEEDRGAPEDPGPQDPPEEGGVGGAEEAPGEAAGGESEPEPAPTPSPEPDPPGKEPPPKAREQPTGAQSHGSLGGRSGTSTTSAKSQSSTQSTRSARGGARAGTESRGATGATSTSLLTRAGAKLTGIKLADRKPGDPLVPKNIPERRPKPRPK